ncbi:MAG: SCP2 sterol-binding domain-containing protein [Colwellia sp.]
MTKATVNLAEILLLKQALCSALEVIINKALALNTNRVVLDELLGKLTQKTLSLQLDELGFVLSFSVNDKKVMVTSLTERTNCTITTSLKTLKELKTNQQLTELIKQDKLDVVGDLKVAQQFARMAENLNIDWQTELANYIGDVPTYKLTQLGKKIASKINYALEQIQADASEYIVHEQRLVVTRSQIDHFNQHVTSISSQVDDVALRIHQLAKRIV